MKWNESVIQVLLCKCAITVVFFQPSPKKRKIEGEEPVNKIAVQNGKFCLRGFRHYQPVIYSVIAKALIENSGLWLVNRPGIITR